MRCLRCDAALEPQLARRAHVHVCPSGHGAFLPRDEARRTIAVAPLARIEEAMAREGSGSSVECPSCHGAMRMFRVPRDGDSIELDGCGACGGYWLDAGEHARLHAKPKATGSARASGRAFAGEGASAMAFVGPDAVGAIAEMFGALFDW